MVARRFRYLAASNAARIWQGRLASTMTSSYRAPMANVSTPRYKAPIHLFDNNRNHTWTLLEACLDLNNFKRAESLILALENITQSSDLTMAVNMYLRKFIDTNPDRNQDVVDWLQLIKLKMPNFEPNEVTDALMLRNACLALPRSHSLLTKALSTLGKPKLISILNQRELLDVETVKQVVEYSQLDIQELSTPIQQLLQDDMSPLESTEIEDTNTVNDDEIVNISDPIAKNDADTLTPTSSIGLASIRYALKGLELNDNNEDHDILKLCALSNTPYSHNLEDINFFEMYQKIENPEDRKQFDAILEKLNIRRQQTLETKGLEAARMRWKYTFQRLVKLDQKSDANISLHSTDKLKWEWFQAMMPLVRKEIEIAKLLAPFPEFNKISSSVLDVLTDKNGYNLTRSEVKYKFFYAPFLLLVNPENLPALTMNELIRLHNQEFTLKSTILMERIGKNVEKEYQLGQQKKSIAGIKTEEASKDAVDLNPKDIETLPAIPHAKWDPETILRIGSLLLKMFISSARIRVSGKDPITGLEVKSTAPAFYHTYKYQMSTKIGIIKCNPNMNDILIGENQTINPQQLPMLCKPKPWTSWNSGGYWYANTSIIRTNNCPEQEAYIDVASSRNQLNAVYEGLNVLNDTSWTVNKNMLQLITKIWNSKETFIDIPAHVEAMPDLSSIPKPARDCDPAALRDYRRKCREVVLKNGSLYSQRCDLNYKLDIARALLGEKFYMPHNLDFRGRAYPLSPHFNHLGNDVSRSLLIFWEGKKLGPNGLWWLKLHLANLFGVNKSNYAERISFVDTNIEKVIQCAEDPLNKNNSWWKTADAPFQALAACIEIREALNCPQGHENYISHLAVHQDGSCNGLQHYAALGGDVEGAREVNLERADKPQDVYSRVLEIVKQKVAKDIIKGQALEKELEGKLTSASQNIKAQIEIPNLVSPILTRKIVKQTVMTNVYGVTFVGAREQISNRLADLPDFPKNKIFSSSAYLAKHVLNSVRELFESAHEIQDWLGMAAKRICNAVVIDKELSENYKSKKSKPKVSSVSAVIWTNPLGLPIVQPYRESKTRAVTTEMQNVYIVDPYSFQPVNTRKQRTALPPNYVHSLDASHMLMTARACANRITFASVHDSYWTHASDVDCLNKTLREKFVELHSTYLIEQLRNEFLQRYADHLEIVRIPADCDLAMEIKEVHLKYIALTKEKSSKTKLRILTASELVDLELRKDKVGSAVDIVRNYDRAKLEQLCAEPTKSSGSQKQKSLKTKSEEEFNDFTNEEEFSDSLDHSANASVSSSKARSIQILVPFYMPPIPKRGSFDVRKVLDSPYFFS